MSIMAMQCSSLRLCWRYWKSCQVTTTVMMMVQEMMTETAPATVRVMAPATRMVMVLAATAGKQAVVPLVVQAAEPESW